jgi:hypothetical protein
LAIGVFGEADGPRLGYPFEPRRNIDAVTHQIAIALFDHIAEMDADAELDAALRRKPGVALNHAVLHFNGAAHGLNDATKLDEDAVARAFDYATVVHGHGWVDQIAAKRPQPRQRPILVRAGKPAKPNHVGRQYRREFARLGHEVLS